MSNIFPKLAGLSGLFFFTLMGLLLLRLTGFGRSEYDTPIVVISTAFSLLIYLTGILTFLWIRRSGQSRLNDDERVRLKLEVDLNLSISFYLAGFLTMVTPFLGLVILTGTLIPESEITSEFGVSPIIFVSIVILAACTFCAVRIKSLFAYPRKK